MSCSLHLLCLEEEKTSVHIKCGLCSNTSQFQTLEAVVAATFFFSYITCYQFNSYFGNFHMDFYSFLTYRQMFQRV